MKACVIILLLVILPFVSPLHGQKKPAKPAPRVYTILPGENSVQEIVPRVKDFAIVAALNANGKAKISFQIDELSSTVTVNDVNRVLDRLSIPQRTPSDPIIIVEPDPDVRYETLLSFVEPLRRYGENRIKVKTSGGQFIIVPAKQEKIPEVKPNPLHLVLQVDRSLRIDLNREPWGSIDDLSGLSNRLAEVFRARTINGVFREGTEIIETTVHLSLPPNIIFHEVSRLDAELRRVGSDRVFLFEPPVKVLDRRKLIY